MVFIPHCLQKWFLFFYLISSASFLGHLDPSERPGNAHPKLWCALSEGKAVVFDASTWSIQQHCFKMGRSKLVRPAHMLRLVLLCLSLHDPETLTFRQSYRKILELFGLQLGLRNGHF